MEEKQRNFFSVIPANVRYDEELSANAKLLYSEITALCNERGYCWATNDYFADLYKVTKRAISRWISELVNKGYITSDIVYKKGTKEIEGRYIRICDIHLGVDDPIDKIVHTYRQNCPYPIDKNVHDNNIILINNNNIKENIEKKSFKRPTLEEVDEYIKSKNMSVDAKTFIDYFDANDWKDSKGNKVKSWKQKLITWNSYNKNKEIKSRIDYNNEVLEKFVEGEDD